MTEDVKKKLIEDHFLFKEGDRFLQAANATRSASSSDFDMRLINFVGLSKFSISYTSFVRNPRYIAFSLTKNNGNLKILAAGTRHLPQREENVPGVGQRGGPSPHHLHAARYD